MARPSKKDDARRLIALIKFLNESHTAVPLQKIAEVFNISLEQARRDIEIVSMCGINDTQLLGVYTSGDEAYVWQELPILEKSLRLSHKESLALMAALDAAGVSESSELRRKVLLATGASEIDRSRVKSLLSSSELENSGELVERISHAITAHQALEISYASLAFTQQAKNSKDAQAPKQVIEPIQLLNYQDKWYVEAFSRKHGEIRTYRLDRMASLRELQEYFDEVHAIGPTKIIELNTQRLAYLAVYDEKVLDYMDLPGIMPIEAEKIEGVMARDHARYYHIPYVSTEFLAHQALASAGALEVLGPPEIRERVRELALQKLNNLN
ncbi:MAG: WYL domain-containing protein [Coriobacteriia bacterium]|nr:WYL domain-containing protein [Coriobacteriia bacterium]